MDRKTTAGHIACFLAYAIFGLNIVFCRDIALCGAIPPLALFTIRAIGATALFWLLSLIISIKDKHLPSHSSRSKSTKDSIEANEKNVVKARKNVIDKEDWWKVIAASLLGLFVPQVTFLKAISMVTTVDASIIQSVNPIFTMFFAAIFLKEPITPKKALGVLISLGGIIFLILNSVHASNGVEQTQPWGVFWLLVNGISFSLYLGIFRPLIAKYDVITFMKWMFLVSLIVSLPLSIGGLIHAEYAIISGKVWLEIGFLVVFATLFAYFLIPYGQQRLRPTLVSMYTYVQPIIAVAVSIIIGMDKLTWQKALAMVLVFAGVALVNRSRAKAN